MTRKADSKKRAGQTEGQHREATEVNAARRRLLRLSVYVPPAIIGSIIMSNDARAAGSVSNCVPSSSCQPIWCTPAQNPPN